jgi:hypothetical protein
MYWKVYPIYILPKDRQKQIKDIRTGQKICEFVDSVSPDNLNKLQGAIRDIETREHA